MVHRLDRTDINSVKHPEELWQILTRQIAVQVIAERDKHGYYDSLDSVKWRVKGIGHKKLEKIEQYCTVSEQELKERSEKQDIGMTRATLLRNPVSTKVVQVWEERNNEDPYTGKTREDYKQEGKKIQVDHVVECQITGRAWEEGVMKSLKFGPTYGTRLLKKQAMLIVNDLPNLVATTSETNQKKKGVFTVWNNKSDSGIINSLAEAMENCESGRYLCSSGKWKPISNTIIKSYIDIYDECYSQPGTGRNNEALENFADTLLEIFIKMKIEEM